MNQLKFFVRYLNKQALVYFDCLVHKVPKLNLGTVRVFLSILFKKAQNINIAIHDYSNIYLLCFFTASETLH